MPPRKKITSSKLSRKSLHLKGNGLLVDLPLDVFLEIFKILHPLDLLYLSRTNKALREFLLDRSNASIWRVSLEHVEGSPPKCPSYTSEVQWTRLLFEEVCHVCYSTLEHDFTFDPIWWEFSARYCSECCPNQVVKKLSLKLAIRARERGVFPCINGFYLAKDINDFLEKYSTANTEAAKTRLVQERREQTKILTDHARVCRPWMERIVQARNKALQDLKDARLAAIRAKFREAGWPNALVHSATNSWEWRQPENLLVQSPKLLSNAEWRRIGPKLTKELENSVKGRVMDGRFRTLEWAFPNLIKFTEKLAFPPRMVDVALFPDVRAILEGDLKREITVDDLKGALESRLPKLLEEWSIAFEAELRDHTRTTLGLSDDGTVDPFEHALAYFVCETKCCQGHFTGHWKPCLAVPYYYSWQRDPASETYEEMVEAVFRRKPCTVENMFMLEPARAAVLEDVIKRYGKDPESATCEEMDAAAGKLWCMRCVEKNQPTGWRDALAHSIKYHELPEQLRARWEVEIETED
ncbi:hypothetical protein B0H19DRAFT_1094306 [Mycena capillaripes]|nr:hypothetical protein B0H19DRAFT_1094306 [Mycena capillaripes]